MEIDLQVDSGKERLDRWLSEQLSDFSRSYLQKLIEQGQLTINGQVCSDKNIKVNLGDRIHLIIPPSEPLAVEAQDIKLNILYEDESLIIINKPAGLVVHPAPGHDSGTLVNALLFHCTDLAGISGVQRPGIVHRLDKDTTGVLVVAKTDFAQANLQAQLKAKTARREYLAIVHGVPKTETGIINLPIGRHPIDRKKMAVIPIEKGGREAVTHWQILERIGNYTLMQFRLETGRTHQIRVHTSHLGYPILGDPVYSSDRSIGINLPGQMLHAHRLILIHPVTKETIETVAPLPPIFTKVLTALRRKI
ncbi:RluA family pseudouridine synthase [Chroococcus sp. FPU101]|uniref:RluA family pseudouridine synthase n=1 Tax=Chroococcus sp. FPU101 TaxID=1974212 RepID=UPI001A8C86B2|nr:RluA family pseudouridine synthase [Chroococcus sp. FPU101]GFE67809.1 ribosomal large subunit pseudouridine synthase D [Chroococcus sp. FPU101]